MTKRAVRKAEPTKPEPEPGPWGRVWLAFDKRNRTRNLSPKSVQFYTWGCAPFAAFLDREGVGLADLTAEHVDDFLGERQEAGKILKGHLLGHRSRTPNAPPRKRTADKRAPLAKRTLNAYARAALALLGFAKKRGLITNVPDIDKPRIPHDEPYRLKTADQWACVLAAVAESALPERDTALLHVILSSGLRRAETAALLWSQVDFDHVRKVASIFVKSGKGDKSRSSALGGEAYTALVAWRAHLKATLTDRVPGHDVPWVWPSIKHAESLRWAKWYAGGCRGPEPEREALGPIEADSIGALFSRLSKRCGTRVTAHSLRHSCARRWEAAGLSATAIQKKLGHASLLTTSRYLGLDDAEAQDQLLDLLAAKT
jgi:integrase